MTCDVEEHSLEKNDLDDSIISVVANEGIPRLLELFDKYDIKATFFITGYFAERSPEILHEIKNNGHEIGCHSYSHDPKLALDRLNFFEQVKEINKSKRIIEKIVGEITSFRAPALRINKYTIDALVYCGFTHDSSHAPGRFDGPLSDGFLEKLKWLNSKDSIHQIDANKKLADGKIIEVPLTSFFLPYIGTLSRISPEIMNLLRPIILRRNLKNG